MYLKPLHKYDKFIYNKKEVTIYNIPTLNWWFIRYMYNDPNRKSNSILKFAWWPKFIFKAKKL